MPVVFQVLWPAQAQQDFWEAFQKPSQAQPLAELMAWFISSHTISVSLHVPRLGHG